MSKADPNILRTVEPCQQKKTARVALHRVTGELTAGDYRRREFFGRFERRLCRRNPAFLLGGGLGGGRRGPLRLIRRRALDHVLAALEVAVPHRAVEIDRGLLEPL